MRALLSIVLGLFLAAPALSAIETREVEYTHGGLRLKGFVAYDNATDVVRPGILIVHEWWGINDFARGRAKELARAGYVAFALDMYGEGRVTDSASEAQQLATPFYQDRSMMRSRAAAGLRTLLEQPHVDPDRIAVIGYCFGGTVALEVARSGAAVLAAVSFHGGLRTPNPDDASKIRAKVLVLTGAADPLVPADEREALIQEMEAAKVDYQMVIYSGAKHSFTNPDADRRNMPAVGYDAAADRRSWAQTLSLFDEVFSQGSAR